MHGKALRILSLVLAAAVTAVAVQVAGARSAEMTGSSSLVEIKIEAFRFLEDTIRVEPGTTIRWTNRDQVGHTSTAENGEWESPLLGPGESFEVRLDDAGRFPYTCTPHPFMRGVVIVESSTRALDGSKLR